MTQNKSTITEPYQGSVEFSPSDFKTRKVNSAEITILLIGLTLVTCLLTFKIHKTTNTNGTSAIEIQLRK